MVLANLEEKTKAFAPTTETLSGGAKCLQEFGSDLPEEAFSKSGMAKAIPLSACR